MILDMVWISHLYFTCLSNNLSNSEHGLIKLWLSLLESEHNNMVK